MKCHIHGQIVTCPNPMSAGPWNSLTTVIVVGFVVLIIAARLLVWKLDRGTK